MKHLIVVIISMLLMTIGLDASAQSYKYVEEQYADWTVMTGDGKPHRYNAITTSTDGDGFLVYSCHVDDTCYLTMLSTAGCDVGSSYPMLMNSDSGASAVNSTCIEYHSDLDSSEYSFSDPDAVLAETVFNDMRVGIAIPLADGKFTALRFSLMGSQEAMARVVQLSTSSGGKKSVESGEF